MPWDERGTMSLKRELVNRVISGDETISSVAIQLGISRKTAYKWLARYNEHGIVGLEDRSRRPLFSPSRVNTSSIELIIKTRRQFRAWGARKLRQYLVNEGYTDLPCEASINRILMRHHLINDDDSQQRKRFIRFERSVPNDLWQMDFKGHFRLRTGRCHPLTVLDDHSRYAICLKACSSETTDSVQQALEAAFKAYGLPRAMTMDNGSPWKGSYPWHMSRLTVWLSRLGIIVSHSSPRHPQTQGKDERFHRSLKEEVLRFYQFNSMDEAQTTFDEWREIYNNKRPHEGISMARPCDRYQKSLTPYPHNLPSIEYLEGDLIRKVRSCGQVSYKQQDVFVGEHLKGEMVALRKVEAKSWRIYYCRTCVGKFKEK